MREKFHVEKKNYSPMWSDRHLLCDVAVAASPSEPDALPSTTRLLREAVTALAEESDEGLSPRTGLARN